MKVKIHGLLHNVFYVYHTYTLRQIKEMLSQHNQPLKMFFLRNLVNALIKS